MKIDNRAESGTLNLIPIIGAVITIFLLISMMAYVGNKTGTTPSMRNDQVDSYSFLVFKDSNNDTLAKEGLAHTIQFKDSDSATVIQDAIDAIHTAGGGSIYIKLGTYEITSTLNITVKNLRITADLGTVLNSSIMPIMRFWGFDFEHDFPNITAGVEVSNIDFLYTGPIVTGAFVQVIKAQPDNTYNPTMYFHDLKIHSTQTTFPTDPTFIGLGLRDLIGNRYERLQVYLWGTCIDFEAGWNTYWGIPEDSEHNYFGHMDLTKAYYGFREHGAAGGHIFYSTYDTVKINQVIKAAMVSIDSEAIMNMPDFAEIGDYYDGTWQVGLDLGGSMTITGGQIMSATDVLINATNSHLTVTGVRLRGGALAFNLTQTYLVTSLNEYYGNTKLIRSDTTYVYGLNDAITTMDYGRAVIPNGVNYVIVTTNLVWYAWQIVLTMEGHNESAYVIGQWGNQGGLESKGSVTFEIALDTNAVGNHYIDWWATCQGTY